MADRSDPWDHDLWRVALGVPANDVAALWHASARAIPVERHFLEPDADGGDATLFISVSADEKGSAVAEASRLYARAREAAGLPSAAPELLGAVPPFLRDTLWHLLFVEAETLASTGRHDLAVVRAQTGLEVYAKTAFEQIVVRRFGERNGGSLARQCRPQLDKSTIDLLAAITGQRATDEPWFEGYRTHLQRRNVVVHRGYSVTAADAHASLEATQACLDWLRDLWAQS